MPADRRNREALEGVVRPGDGGSAASPQLPASSFTYEVASVFTPPVRKERGWRPMAGTESPSWTEVKLELARNS